jgi:putative ABC transport system permease protein
MLFITTNDGLSGMPGSEALKVILMLGSIVIAIFSVIILLYTNSFLMKRRKKELGLFNILGMEKKHIAKVMALENFYIAVISLFLGLLTGILLSKLMFMLLLKLLRFAVPFGFKVSTAAITVTVILFTGIFILTLFGNLLQVHLSKPIELLHGGNTGEKEPKTKLLLAVFGFITLAAGYTIAVITESPLDALGLFFIAVILVIAGTYCLFTAGSIALLKMLRKNKNYYYKTKNFTSVSGMLYRMKQNAVGLSNICILSTMVLVMLSGTISLYFGMENALRNRFPRNIEITATDISAADRDMLDKKINTAIDKSGTGIENKVNYRFINYNFKQNGSLFTFDRDGAYADYKNAIVFFIPVDEYNKMQGTSVALSESELMVYSPNASYTDDKISFDNIGYSVKEALDTLNVEEHFSLRLDDIYYFIMPDEQSIHTIYNILTDGTGDWQGFIYYYGFDVSGGAEQQTSLAGIISEQTADVKAGNGADIQVYTTCAESNKSEFLSVYGGLFFLGIFLGALFIMATVLIMYYKQISEGYDDKSRYEIMQKVGMSRDEVKKTIRSQVLIVFFLPLAVAGIHIAAAFKMITRLLAILNLTNVALFVWCTLGTILVFAILYSAVYVLTARVYYKIVE